MSHPLKLPLFIIKTSQHLVGGVNPNNVRRGWSTPELVTWRPSDWMDYHILYMLYSAHSNLTREGEGCGVREHSGKKFKSAFYVNTQSWYTKGGIMRWRIIHESACFTAQANWRSNNKDTWGLENRAQWWAGNSHLKPILTRVTLQRLRLQPENTKAWENRKFNK